MDALAATTPNTPVLPSPDDLVAALRSAGYFKVRCDHDLTAIIQGAFDEAERFFSLPLELKTRSALAGEMEGYRGYASEYCEVEDRPDLCESFWLHAFNIDQARARFDGSGLPLYERVVAAAARFDLIVSRLILSMERHYWGSTSDRPRFRTEFGSHLQLNYYAPRGEQRDLLLDPHEDGLLFTLLSATAPGLEIRNPDGSFTPMQTAVGELLIFPGEIVTLLSGGEIAPLYHRVRHRPDVPKRMSLMYFSNPNASRTRRLKPWRETPINRDVDIMRRVIENPIKFGLPPIPMVEDG